MPLQVKKVQLKVKDGNQYIDGDMLFNVDAEAWATGKRNGSQIVDTNDPAYHNNALYYKNQAATSATSAAEAALTGNLALVYNSSSTYAVGDHVLYDGGYYVCNTAITTAEAWTAAHWTAVKVGLEITDLKTQLNGMIEGKNLIFYDVIPNQYPSETGFPSYSGWDRSDYIPVTPGDTLCITNPGHKTNDNFWYNDGKTPTTKFTIPIGNPVEITVPEGAAYVVISNERANFFGDVYTKVTAYATPVDIDNINNTINDIEEQLEIDRDSLSKIEETENINLTMNRYQTISMLTKTINTSAGGSFYVSSPVSVNPGELYKITSEGYGTAAAFALGNNGTLIEVYPQTYQSTSQSHYVIDKLIKIPTGINEIYISNTTQGEDTQYSLKKIVESRSLKYIPQNLTDNQQHQAQQNINAVSKDDFDEIVEYKWMDYSITTTGSKLINSTGVVTDYANHDDYMITNSISVEGESVVQVSGSANYYNSICVFYDSDDNVVEIALKSRTGSSTITSFSDEELDVPASASYMVLAGVDNAPTAKYVDGYTLAKKFTGLKWAAVGDSLTEVNSRTTKHYHDYIADETGIFVYNMGASGTGYKRKEDSNKAFYQRVLNLPLDSDVVTIFGSGNDQTYYGTEDMGTATDTGTTTLGGCINTTIDNIYSVLPTVQLGIIAPCPWQGYNPVNHDNGMAKYTELLRQICENRSIPFLDLYHSSNLRPWDAAFRALAYTKDDGGGTHPDETGHKLLAGRIRVFLDSLIGLY